MTKILLVDDETDFVSALAERLCLRGMEAEWAGSAEEALKKLKNTGYDLAVLDVKMPGIGGIDLKRRIQEMDPEMKFIFCTGHGSQEDFDVGSVEAAHYLVKPLNIDELMQKIEQTLAE